MFRHFGRRAHLDESRRWRRYDSPRRKNRRGDNLRFLRGCAACPSARGKKPRFSRGGHRLRPGEAAVSHWGRRGGCARRAPWPLHGARAVGFVAATRGARSGLPLSPRRRRPRPFPGARRQASRSDPDRHGAGPRDLRTARQALGARGCVRPSATRGRARRARGNGVARLVPEAVQPNARAVLTRTRRPPHRSRPQRLPRRVPQAARAPLPQCPRADESAAGRGRLDDFADARTPRRE